MRLTNEYYAAYIWQILCIMVVFRYIEHSFTPSFLSMKKRYWAAIVIVVIALFIVFTYDINVPTPEE